MLEREWFEFESIVKKEACLLLPVTACYCPLLRLTSILTTGKMIGTVESCVACILLMVAFTFTSGETRKCQLDASPHPDGICGQQLATAHANLCFLMRRAYPEFFPSSGKRSVMATPYDISAAPTAHSSTLEAAAGSGQQQGEGKRRRRRRRDLRGLERIYSIPVSVLASLQLTDENWRSFVYKKRDAAGAATGIAMAYPRERMHGFRYSMEDLSQLRPLNLNTDPSQPLLRLLSKRSNSVQKRDTVGLVCDCCINQCNARHLATYC